MTNTRIGVVGGQGGENVDLYATCLIEKICPQYVLNLIIIFLDTCKKTQINKERFTYSWQLQQQYKVFLANHYDFIERNPEVLVTFYKIKVIWIMQ